MKKVCYTVITNGYDSLKEPLVVTEGWSYVCFTDDPTLKSDVWEIVPFTEHNRKVKILGHKYFDGVTVYVDGSFIIKMDLNILLCQIPSVFSIVKHPKRNCIYEELQYLSKQGIVNSNVAAEQCARYRHGDFPAGYGLGEHGIMIRDFGSKQVREVCQLWWEEFLTGVQRDQASLSYCFWKTRMSPYYIERGIRNKFFKKNKHAER